MTEHATARALREEADAHVQEIAALRIDLDAALVEINRLRGEISYLKDEVIPVLKADAGRGLRLEAALRYIRNTCKADGHDGFVEFCDKALGEDEQKPPKAWLEAKKEIDDGWDR